MGCFTKGFFSSASCLEYVSILLFQKKDWGEKLLMETMVIKTLLLFLQFWGAIQSMNLVQNRMTREGMAWYQNLYAYCFTLHNGSFTVDPRTCLCNTLIKNKGHLQDMPVFQISGRGSSSKCSPSQDWKGYYRGQLREAVHFVTHAPQGSRVRQKFGRRQLVWLEM